MSPQETLKLIVRLIIQKMEIESLNDFRNFLSKKQWNRVLMLIRRNERDISRDLSLEDKMMHCSPWTFRFVISNNWNKFRDIFYNQKAFYQKFTTLVRYRNFESHAVEVEIVTLEGKAAIIWFGAMINPNNHQTKQLNLAQLETIKMFLANKYIKNPEEKEIFLNEAIQFKLWANYIAALILTKRDRKTFTNQDIKKILKEELIPNHFGGPGVAEGSLLTQDAEINSKKYHGGCPSLKRISKGRYKFVGFRQGRLKQISTV